MVFKVPSNLSHSMTQYRLCLCDDHCDHTDSPLLKDITILCVTQENLFTYVCIFRDKYTSCKSPFDVYGVYDVQGSGCPLPIRTQNSLLHFQYFGFSTLTPASPMQLIISSFMYSHRRNGEYYKI